jgi:3',5'-nucleoside bisphosphate phosphatase
MLRRYAADLHIHTVLSPCADYRMVPEIIVARAKEVGLNLIAITDHSSGENAAAVTAAAAGSGVEVLPGMEVESREGVHLLTIFDEIEALARWQEETYRSLPQARNVARTFGVQLVVTPDGQLVREETRLLITAVSLSYQEIGDAVLGMGGVCIPAHVDRPAYGLISVLGFMPDEPRVPAVEISPRCQESIFVRANPSLRGIPFLCSSDAHRPEEIGRAFTTFVMAAGCVREIELACAGHEGRAIAGRHRVEPEQSIPGMAMDASGGQRG